MTTIGTIDVSDRLRETLVVKVKFGRTFTPRIWPAAQMMRLVALVCPLEVEVADRD